MYFLTTVSKWQGEDGGRRIVNDSPTTYLINPSNIAEIVVLNGETRVLFSDLYNNSRSGLSYFWCNTSLADIILASDSPMSSGIYSLDVFYKNDPLRSTSVLNIKYNNLIFAWAYSANANYSWVVYQNGEKIVKILVSKALTEILDDAMKYSSTININAGVNTVITTTLTVVPYSVQLLDSSGNDVSNLLVSITLVGGVYVLTFYSIDALLNCKLYLLY